MKAKEESGNRTDRRDDESNTGEINRGEMNRGEANREETNRGSDNKGSDDKRIKREGRLWFMVLIAVISAGFSAWAEISAQAAEGIGTVKVKVVMEGFDDSGSPVFSADTSDKKYEVENMTLVPSPDDSRALGPGACPQDSQGTERKEAQELPENREGPPVYEILLRAEEDFFFQVMERKDLQLTGIESKCTKAVRRDSGRELVLTVMLTGAKRLIGEVEWAAFASPSRAVWSQAPNASGYEILLYKDGRRIGFPHRTEGTEYDLAPLMREAGAYYFKVYPLSSDKRKGKPVLSEKSKLDSRAAGENRALFPECQGDILEGETSSLPGWREDEKGRRYLYSDGMYPQKAWVSITEKEYYFDQNGYLVENMSGI